MSEIQSEIIQQFGLMPTSTSGWSKQLNQISWNDRGLKFEIRDWSADGSKMGKGVMLTREVLNSMEF